MNVTTTTAIDDILRPILAARRLLRDYGAYRYSLTGNVCDDPPNEDAIHRAMETVRDALRANPHQIDEMLMDVLEGSCNAIHAVVDAVSDKRRLPPAAVAGALRALQLAHMGRLKSDGTDETVLPDHFLRLCQRERRSLEELLNGLTEARDRMRRQGRR